jgi:restriction system protein
MVRAGRGSYVFEEFEKKGCVALGWAGMGDISGITTREDLGRRHDEAAPELSKAQRGVQFGMIARFVFDLAEGDNVITYDSDTRVYLVGKIAGPHRYQPDRVPDHPNVRDVKWVGKVSRDDLTVETRNTLGSTLALFLLNDTVVAEIQSVLKGVAPPVAEPDAHNDLDILKAEMIGSAHEFIKDKVKALGWDDMQDLVAGILRAMGYKTLVSNPGSDLGKDIVASPDGLGLEQPRIRVEVKHRKGAMGAPEIRSFIGALRQGDKGLYISTGGFSKEANYEAERATVPVTLVDLDALVLLLTEHYEHLDAEARALVPLKRIYWPVG